MKFKDLNERIPYAIGGKEKILRMSPYPNILLAMPGRHANQTNPQGGDFCVIVTDSNVGWNEHQFTHTDLFKDIERRGRNTTVMEIYLQIVLGTLDPEGSAFVSKDNSVLDFQTLLYAVQCLAVAEHRRFARFEPQGGGRYLPFRFSAGIVEGKWSASDAADKQKRGRPGVEWLEKDYGMPKLTQRLLEEL